MCPVLLGHYIVVLVDKAEMKAGFRVHAYKAWRMTAKSTKMP